MGLWKGDQVMKLNTLTDNQLIRLYRKYYNRVASEGGALFGLDYRTVTRGQGRIFLALNTEMEYRGIV